MTENKIIPLGGKHKSPQSLLAEVMNDPNLTKVAVFTFHKDGSMGQAYIGLSNAEMAFVGAVATRTSLEDTYGDNG